jgi:hypothetical protein
LTSAYEASEDPFVRHRIEKAIIELLKGLEGEGINMDEFYKALVEGILDTRIPLQILGRISHLLPGNPQTAETTGRVEGGFFFKDRQHQQKTLVGLNESGQRLIGAMISAVMERSAKEGADKSTLTKKVEKQ